MLKHVSIFRSQKLVIAKIRMNESYLIQNSKIFSFDSKFLSRFYYLVKVTCTFLQIRLDPIRNTQNEHQFNFNTY